MFTEIAISLVCIGILMLPFISHLWNSRRRQRVARARGCSPAPSAEQRDRIFGLDSLIQLYQSHRKNRRNVSMRVLFDRYGHTFQANSWSQTKIFSIEPQNLQSVLTTDFTSWGVQPLRLFAFEPFVGKGIMCSDGKFWEQSRALVKPTFARSQIADLHLKTFDAHVQKLIAWIPGDGSSVDLQPLFSRLALDSSTEFLFGESIFSLSSASIAKDGQDFLDACNHGQTIVGKRFLLPHWNILTWDRKFWRSCQVVHEFVEKNISRARHEIDKISEKEATPTRFILAHELVKANEDEVDIRNQLLNTFLPAQEATGVALTNVFFQLARNPAVYLRLRKEILEYGSYDSSWTFERLKSLRYLQNVIQETFRLNPPVGTTVRIALRDTILPTGGGLSVNKTPLYVNKGDIITFSLYSLHRRKDIFGDDADIFKPERWETLRPPHWSYMPFSGGRRICLGQNLALTEVAYALVKIVQAFKTIENRDPVLDFIEVYKLTTNSKNGAKVAFLSA